MAFHSAADGRLRSYLDFDLAAKGSIATCCCQPFDTVETAIAVANELLRYAATFVKLVIATVFFVGYLSDRKPSPPLKAN
jgi:hypothetical protein